MIVITITAILTALAVPSFSVTLDNQRISGAAEAVLSDLRWARSEAIKRNKELSIIFTNGAPYLYCITEKSTTCTGPIKTVSSANFNEFDNVSLSQNFTSGILKFEPSRGTANAGTVTITYGNYSAEVIVSF